MGVAADGSLAASMQGGLLVLCDLPQSATAPTGFSPQRMQVLIGFAYTGVAATDEPGGFGLGGLLGGDFTDGGASFGSSDGFTGRTSDLAAGPAALTTGPLAPGADIAAPPVEAAAAEAAAPPAVAAPRPPARPRVLAVSYAMDPSHRVVLALVCLAAWAALTHLGLRRLRGVTEG
jgi:hypothetical protein